MKSILFLSASVVVHGTVGVCLWTSAHSGSLRMSIQKGDNSANIVIVSPGELNPGKTLAKPQQKSSSKKEDVSDFIQPSEIKEKDIALVPPNIHESKSSAKPLNKEDISPAPFIKENENLSKAQSKQNAVCIVIPGRQIGVETISEASNVNPAPRYPKIAILKGWEGETVVKVSVNSAGKVEHIEVMQFSGHAVLDNAVLEAVQNWHFEKGPDKVLEIPVRFILKNAV